MKLPWDDWEVANSEVSQVAEKFVMANCYDPKIAAQFFNSFLQVSFLQVVPDIENLKPMNL